MLPWAAAAVVGVAEPKQEKPMEARGASAGAVLGESFGEGEGLRH